MNLLQIFNYAEQVIHKLSESVLIVFSIFGSIENLVGFIAGLDLK